MYIEIVFFKMIVKAYIFKMLFLKTYLLCMCVLIYSIHVADLWSLIIIHIPITWQLTTSKRSSIMILLCVSPVSFED